MKKQLLFCFIGFALFLGFKNQGYSAPIAKASNSARTTGTTYTWTGEINSNWSNPANWSPSNGYPGMTVNVFDNVVIGVAVINPVVDTIILYCGSIEITGNSTLTLHASLRATSLTINPGATFSTGVTTFNPYSPYYFATGDVTVKDNAAFITTHQSEVFTNNITLLTSSYFQNGGLVVSYQSNISFSYSSYLLNLGEFKCSGSNINMSSGTSYIYNGRGCTFSAVLAGNSPIIDIGFQSFINNDGTFYIHGYNVHMGNSSSIYNSNNGIFTIAEKSTVDFALNSAATASIKNAGLFYAGTSNSPCTINLDYPGVDIINNNIFYLGSTSVINLTAYGTSVKNVGQFTLQSDTYGSAAIGNIKDPSAQCFGTYYVERYISGGSPTYRGYRLLSSPVSVATIPTNYSLNYVTKSLLPEEDSTKESPTTGTNGTSGGFDKTGNPTLYLFRDNIPISNSSFVSGNFRGVSDIHLAPTYSIDGDPGSWNIPIGNGFLFFFRGNKTNLATKFKPGTSAESVTLSSYGYLNSGQITTHQWFTPALSTIDYNPISGINTGFALVGNPYPSAIDWDTFNSSSPSQGIYGATLPSFMYTLDPVSQNYSVYQANTGGGGTNSVNQNIISSGQGFFVQAADATAQLIFNESAKINTTTQATTLAGNLFLNARLQNPNVYPTINKASQAQYVHLKLLRDTNSVDGMIVSFNSNAKSQFDKREDALYKPGNGTASLSCMSSDSVALSINTQALPKLQSSIIRLNVTANTDGLYQLNMIAVKNIPALYDIWLKDAYKKDSLDIKHNPNYSFNIYKSDPASFGANRFSLVIRQNPALGVHLLNFTALKVTAGAQVIWKTENEADYTSFSLERSTDNGTTFTALTGFTSSTVGTYGFLDPNPKTNVAGQYRLKLTDLNGTVTYSKVVVLQYAPLSNNIVNNNITVYPNPASGTINVSINSGSIASNNSPGLPGGTLSYGIKIINITGSVVTTALTAASNWQGIVSNLAPGTYILQVVNSSDQSLVGKSTFIKL